MKILCKDRHYREFIYSMEISGHHFCYSCKQHIWIFEWNKNSAKNHTCKQRIKELKKK